MRIEASVGVSVFPSPYEKEKEEAISILRFQLVEVPIAGLVYGRTHRKD